MEDIKAEPAVGFSIEGAMLGRYSQPSLLSFATASCTFLFDILTLGDATFDNGLRDILESELHGTTREELKVPTLHLPDNITVVTDFELQQLREIQPLATRQLDDIHDRVTASMQTYDVKPLLHSQQTSLLQERRTNHLIIITTSLCAILIFSILCFLLYTHARYGTYCVCKTDESTPRAKNDPKPEDARGETREHCVIFHYALQQDG